MYFIGTLEDGLWMFPDSSNLIEILHQGIFVLNSLIVVLNFNSSKLIPSFALHLFLLIAKPLLVKHHYLEHELSHKFLVIFTVSVSPFERLKNSIRSRQQKKFCFEEVLLPSIVQQLSPTKIK